MSASTDANGSSSSRTRGPETSARAIATRCCIPPESCQGYVRVTPWSPTSARIDSARATLSAFVSPVRRSGNMTFRVTFSHGNSERP